MRHSLEKPTSHHHAPNAVIDQRPARRFWPFCLALIPLVVPIGAANAMTAEPPAPVRPAIVSSPSASPGSASIGSMAYPVPAGAVYVSPKGTDGAKGSLAAPLRTITRAIALVPPGGTIILRAGTYHESLLIWNKKMTIQNYPHEAVWLDGSSAVTGWTGSGNAWVTAWRTKFDHSPTYTWGAPDGPPPGMQFVSPSFPMAAHPDQVWIDGSPLKQVGSRSQVQHGTFYVDEGARKLYVGSSPSGHAVRASTLAKALTVQAAGTTLRGFGIRRYAPSVPHMGSVTLERPAISVENVVVSDMATTGIFAGADNITLKNVDVLRSGMLGIGANSAYGLKLLDVNLSDNNTEHFNMSPVSGGFKVARSRGLTVRNSRFVNNTGPAIWQDQSDYDSTIVGNRFEGNTGAGVFLEISAKSLVANNLFLHNGRDGLEVNNTSDVKVWNNTFVGNGRSLNLVQDSRLPTNTSYGHDARRPFPDPTMPWVLGPVTVRNNVVAQQRVTGNCLLCVEDYSHKRTAQAFGITANGDVYNRLNGWPTWATVWSRGPGNPAVFNTLSQFSSTTGQERAGRLYDGASIVDAAGRLSPSVLTLEGSIAQPLPGDVAAAVGQPTGARHLGSWQN